jgi:hypothetical protein
MAFTFSEKIKVIGKLLGEPKVLSTLLSQRDFGYLLEVGWFNSFKSHKSVDNNGKPIPWFSYPFIDFLTPRLSKEITVFEFGSGNSTLFFAERVKKVISIEHNKAWYQIVNKSKPNNVDLMLTKSDSSKDYLDAIKNMNVVADVIIVDGLHRIDCLQVGVEKLSDKGVIVLDDSERNEYKPGIDFVLQKGFKSLEFWGIAPTVLFKKCTTVFYRSNNCLEI